MKKKSLIINGYQTHERSKGKLTELMVKIAQDFLQKNGCEVMITEIDKGFDIDQEVEKHLQADLVILQTPIYWFGAPWLHKKYVDEVFDGSTGKMFNNDGRSRYDIRKQYGSGGNMQGRKMMLSSTWNAPEITFNNPKNNLTQGKNVDEILIGLLSPYRFCGYEILPHFTCFDVMKNPQVEQYKKEYEIHLKNILSLL